MFGCGFGCVPDLSDGYRMATIWVVVMIQITSSKGALRNARVAHQAVAALGRADAMGLLPRKQRIDTLDLPALRTVLKYVHRAGIGRAVQAAMSSELADDAPALEHLLNQLNLALEESPAPEYEWGRLADILGIDLLAKLLGISSTSVRRYKAAARSTPDDVAARLHLLTMIIGDLSGAYNEMGIRQWFVRKRAQLGGRAPAEFLKRDWDPKGPGPTQVRELARALTASPAT
jgi:hypothetical protein